MIKDKNISYGIRCFGAKRCPRCNENIPSVWRFHAKCGWREHSKKCPKCGEDIGFSWNSHRKCGWGFQ